MDSDKDDRKKNPLPREPPRYVKIHEMTGFFHFGEDGLPRHAQIDTDAGYVRSREGTNTVRGWECRTGDTSQRSLQTIYFTRPQGAEQRSLQSNSRTSTGYDLPLGRTVELKAPETLPIFGLRPGNEPLKAEVLGRELHELRIERIEFVS